MIPCETQNGAININLNRGCHLAAIVMGYNPGAISSLSSHHNEFEEWEPVDFMGDLTWRQGTKMVP